MDDLSTQSNDGSGDIKERARETVEHVKERAGERIESRISESKARAAETLSGVASTLKSSSQQLREQHEGAGRAFERAAEGVERFAHYLQETNVDDVVDQVHEFARRQPAAFIGGAFALGFIASRFLKATPSDGVPRKVRGYAASYDTTHSYENGSVGYGAGASAAAGDTPSRGYETRGGSDAGSR